MDDFEQAVVMDIGSGSIKAGFAGDDAPRSYFSNVIGRPKYPRVIIDSKHKNKYIGEEAISKRGVLKLEYPIQHGIITDWDAMEEIYFHTYQQELQLKPQDRPLLITEPPHNPKRNREKMMELLFEKIKVPKVHVLTPSVAIVCSSGRMPKLALDIGDGVIHVMPVYYGGYTVKESVARYNFGGKDINDYLARLLNSRGHSFFTSAELEIVREIKHQVGYVNPYSSKVDTKIQKEFRLPDGRVIQVGEERFEAPEILFSPFLAGLPFPGIHEIIETCINKCDIDLRDSFYEDIVLSGGSSMFPGLAERLQKELSILIPQRRIAVIAPPERKYSTWIGASILASLTTFQSSWIDYQEYQETGPSIAFQKCF